MNKLAVTFFVIIGCALFDKAPADVVVDYNNGNINRLHPALISFYELFNDTARFHEKGIIVRGYLVNENGYLALYPNLTSLDMYVSEDSIELQTSASDPNVSEEAISPLLKNKLKASPQFVSVYGVFQFNRLAGGPNRLGVVYVKSISEYNIIRNLIPPPPPPFKGKR